MVPEVLVTESIAQEGIDLLQTETKVDLRLGLKSEQLQTIIGGYEALVVRSETPVTASLIEAGKHLQVIGRAGVGVDNIDVDAATARGIVVVNAPTGNTIAAAEHTVALMLALARHIPQAHGSLKEGRWQRSNFIGVEVRNKTLGIIGLGHVGTEVARRARGLEMRVLGHDPFVSFDYARNQGVELVSLDELFRRSDFITVHTPLSQSTRGLIGAEELLKMKPGVRLINAARGGIIDEEALLRAVESGRVAGAAVDVFTQEPVRDSPLLKSDRIIVTPHLGASTAEAQTSVSVDVAEQILAVLKGKPARYAVNAPLIPPETLAAIAPYIEVASTVGKLASQLAEGQLNALSIKYEGEMADYHTAIFKAAVLGGLLQNLTEERVNLVNANIIAQRRGLKVIEHKEALCQNYTSLLTVDIESSTGVTTVAGTLMRGETHIVKVNQYWIDLVPSGGYWLFSAHRDRPGLIGAVGNVTGKADIDISSMQVSRLQPRGQALMVLGLDEPLQEEHIKQILAIPDVYTTKLVKL